MPDPDEDGSLDSLATRWRACRAPADLIALAELVPIGVDGQRLIEYFGPPVLVSPLADGGESWLYVRSDADSGQFESLSLALSADRQFAGLNRKPIE